MCVCYDVIVIDGGGWAGTHKIKAEWGGLTVGGQGGKVFSVGIDHNVNSPPPETFFYCAVTLLPPPPNKENETKGIAHQPVPTPVEKEKNHCKIFFFFFLNEK